MDYLSGADMVDCAKFIRQIGGEGNREQLQDRRTVLSEEEEEEEEERRSPKSPTDGDDVAATRVPVCKYHGWNRRADGRTDADTLRCANL